MFMSNGFDDDEDEISDSTHHNDIKSKEGCFNNKKDNLPSTSNKDRTFILPDINITDKVSRKKVSFAESNSKFSTVNSTFKLPYIDSEREKWLGKDVNVKYGTTNEIVDDIDAENDRIDSDYNKCRLEDSLRESLQNYDQRRYYMEGENKSTRHLLLEMNEFYLEMAEQLRLLKGNLLTSAHKKVGEEDSEESSISSYETELHTLISSIEVDDQKVAANVKILKELKEERNIIHEEIKSLCDESDKNDKHTKESKLEVPHFLMPKENVKPENDVEQPEKVINNTKKKNDPCEGKDFVAKNRELAKEYNMSRYCLTDEEKRRLQILLADIDVCEEENTENCIKKTEEHEKEFCELKDVDAAFLSNKGDTEDHENEDVAYNCTIRTNGFKFHTSESEILNDLDLKLIDMKAEETVIETKASDNIENFNDLKEAENKGRPWKFQLLQKRLKHIEKDLVAIRLEKEKENENTEKSDDVEVQNKENIAEEYKRSICDISIDIEELEYEETKELDKTNELENDTDRS